MALSRIARRPPAELSPHGGGQLLGDHCVSLFGPEVTPKGAQILQRRAGRDDYGIGAN